MALRVTLVLALALAGGCESRPRREAGGASLSDTAAQGATTTNVYRFVTADQSLADARKADKEERWADAQAAAQALLKQEPGHLEAQRLAAKAAIEIVSAPHFEAFQKALAAHDTTAAGQTFRLITPESVYAERARPDYEKLRDQWVSLHEGETKVLVAHGRCKDAHRVARGANETFPELRARLDLLADNCKPAAGQDVESDPEPGTAAPGAPVPPVAVAVAPWEPKPVAEPPARPVEAPFSSAPVVVTPPAPPPLAPAPVPAKPAGPKMIPAIELEKLRIAGDKRPALPAGAKMIAYRDGVKTISAALGLCITTDGAPEKVELVKPAEFADVNEFLLAEVNRWRFRPYYVGDAAVPVCTRVLFIWRIE